MTDEQEQRLKEIRRARELGILPWSHLSNPTQRFDVATTTIDFLLSLVDSQVADVALVENYVSEVKRELGLPPNAHLSISLDRYKERVATSMRSACIDAIKSLRAVPHGAAYNNAINDAIHKIESLTIQEQKS